MRDQLVKYIDLLFAGARDADDIKQEMASRHVIDKKVKQEKMIK